MSAWTEEQVLIPAEGGPLVGVLAAPAGAPRAAWVCCYPLFEERKSAQRPYVELARAAAAEGVAVLRFDYRGCGDSPGAMDAFTPDGAVADIRAAAAWLAARFPLAPLGGLGLRLGAALLLRAAAGLTLRAAALWEPVADGRAYLDQELRRKLVREMMTFGDGRQTRAGLVAELEAGRTVDFDGYPLTPAIHRGLAATGPDDAAGLRDADVLLLQLGHATALAPPLARLRAALEGAANRVTARALRSPPIWSLVGLVDSRDVVDATCVWLRELS